ncbi:hypothetical protein evm_014124 [Chilo suppressalis]|nr:hypothetical protein evm_014124 [Chilo suppressalis]
MDAKYNLNLTEHHAICEDMVQSSRGHIMEHIEHKPNKIFEESFVGPSQIFTYEPGKAMAQGTQIVTVQQLVMQARAGGQQTAKEKAGNPLSFSTRKCIKLVPTLVFCSALGA